MRLIVIPCILMLVFSSLVNAWPASTDFPILKPAGDLALSSDVETATEDSDTIVVEAGTTSADGIIIEENNENGKEFDPNDCLLPKERGPCRAAIDSWFFNIATKTCENFLYSGCKGNNNRFPAKSACEARCSLSPSINSSSPATPVESSSSTTSEASPSEASVKESPSSTTTPTTTTTTTTTFKPKLPDCPKFDGCSPKCVIIQDRSDRGCKKCLCGTSTTNDDESKQKQNIPSSIQVSSGNNLTVTEPVGSVSGIPSSISKEDIPSDATISDENEQPVVGKPQEVCQLPAKRGHCRAMQTRYRYDSKVKDCVPFHYGGCDKNLNNFVTKEKCVEYCKGQ